MQFIFHLKQAYIHRKRGYRPFRLTFLSYCELLFANGIGTAVISSKENFSF